MWQKIMVVVAALMGVFVAVPQASAQCRPQIISGSMDWGIKRSYRQYIDREGSWTLSGDVTEDADPRAADFQFHFEIDPDNSFIEVENGQVVAADIRTTESSIEMQAYGGALYTNISRPFLEVRSPSQAVAGASYVGYYVPGKEMTAYTVADRIPANEVRGRDSFAAGGLVSEVTSAPGGGNIISLQTQDLTYVPKAGTQGGAIEGVDIIFMGMYSKDYKPAMEDEVFVTLQTTGECSAELEQGQELGSSADFSELVASFSQVWNKILAVFTVLSMISILGSAVYSQVKDLF